MRNDGQARPSRRIRAAVGVWLCSCIDLGLWREGTRPGSDTLSSPLGSTDAGGLVARTAAPSLRTPDDEKTTHSLAPHLLTQHTNTHTHPHHTQPVRDGAVPAPGRPRGGPLRLPGPGAYVCVCVGLEGKGGREQQAARRSSIGVGHPTTPCVRACVRGLAALPCLALLWLGLTG
jgi:hypothetical protein